MARFIWRLLPLVFFLWFIGEQGRVAQSGQAEQARGVIRFTRDVMPLLSRLACNSAACHASSENGWTFRLSPLGSDPQADFEQITRGALATRIRHDMPEQSLLLVRSKYEQRCRRQKIGAEAYRVLRDWIRQGAPGLRPDEPRLQKLEIAPAALLLSPGARLPFVANAHWSDGTVEDVTRRAVIRSGNDQVASCSPEGLATGNMGGFTTVHVRYLDQSGWVRVRVRFGNPVDKLVIAHRNFVDDHVGAAWRQVGLRPAGPVNDAAFLRRAHLHLTGELPAPHEVRRFLASHDPAKRKMEIDALLKQPEYAEHWANLWSTWFLEYRQQQPEHRQHLARWLRSAFSNQWPLDRLARELLLAAGPIDRNGAVGFFAGAPTAGEAASAASRALLGSDLSCAKCHFHPHGDWTTEDFLDLQACFQRIGLRKSGQQGLSPLELFIENDALRTASQPAVAPRLFGSRLESVTRDSDPRAAFARWLTTDGKLIFARNVVSRYWAELFDRGAVDLARESGPQHPASQPALLDALAHDFIDHGYDARHLLRTLCNSQVYQLSSEPNALNQEDREFYPRFNVARLRGRVLLRVLRQATLSDKGDVDLAPSTYMLDQFHGPAPPSPCQRRIPDANLSQVLHLINSSAISDMLSDPRGRIARLMASGRSDARITEELYLAAFSRPPKASERVLIQKHLEKLRAEGSPRQVGFQDILWALINTKEFLFIY